MHGRRVRWHFEQLRELLRRAQLQWIKRWDRLSFPIFDGGLIPVFDGGLFPVIDAGGPRGGRDAGHVDVDAGGPGPDSGGAADAGSASTDASGAGDAQP